MDQHVNACFLRYQETVVSLAQVLLNSLYLVYYEQDQEPVEKNIDIFIF